MLSITIVPLYMLKKKITTTTKKKKTQRGVFTGKDDNVAVLVRQELGKTRRIFQSFACACNRWSSNYSRHQ